MSYQPSTSQEELGTWDPRLEDYLGWGDVGTGYSFPLSHTRVAGQPRVVQQRPRGLYIRNLPGTMTAEGVRRLFGEHGKVESVVMGRAGTDTSQPRWAIVNPHSTRDAAAMLVGVNGRPPLCLEVVVAISPEEKQQHRQEREAQQHFLEEVRRDVQAAGVKGNTPIMNTCSDESANTVVTTVTASTTTTTAAHHEICQIPFEVGCGVVVVEHRPAMPCVWCGAPGQLVCGGCGAWYCRQLCQAADWPLHSSSCPPVSASIPPSCPDNLCEY